MMIQIIMQFMKIMPIFSSCESWFRQPALNECLNCYLCDYNEFNYELIYLLTGETNDSDDNAGFR